MCRNGKYTERGIKEIHGFMSERWRIEPEYAIKVDPTLGLLGVLLEPTTVVTKAWEQVVGRRAAGVLGAAHGARHGRRADRPARRSPRNAARARRPRPRPGRDRAEARARPGARRDVPLRARSTDVGFEPDIIIECTGVGQVIADSLEGRRPPAASCVSRASAAAATWTACRPRTSRPRSSSGTTSSSAASTRTSGTGTGPGRRSRARTAPGSSAS